MDEQEDSMQGWAYQQEIEHQRYLAEQQEEEEECLLN